MKRIHPVRSRASDEQILTVLHMIAEGATYSAAAKAIGRSKNTVAGIVSRHGGEPDIPDTCIKPENMDGGMPPMWWKQ